MAKKWCGGIEWAGDVQHVCGECPDAHKPPLCLVPVCGISDIWTGLEKFGDRRDMVKNVLTVQSGHLVAIW